MLKNGGFVACRESDSGSFIVYPDIPALQLYKELWPYVQGINGARSDAGRCLFAWALEAGFEEEKIEYSADNLTTRNRGESGIWGKIMAQRAREDETWRQNALKTGRVDEEGIERIAKGWEEFVSAPGAVCSMINGQVIARK